MRREREPNPKVLSRIALAEKRLRSVLARHAVAHLRTLEQKISDAGPTDQRIEPVLLSQALSGLRGSGEIVSATSDKHGARWHYLAASPSSFVHERLEAQRPVYLKTIENHFVKEVGQALEIAVYKAINAANWPIWGGFADLNELPGLLLKKKEPPTFYRQHQSPSPLDFHAMVAGQMLGIEVKNTREWIYVNSEEVRKLLIKALALDMVPVLIARRISYVTMRTFADCGILAHQTYNQRYPIGRETVAAQAANKHLLGYHDVRVGTDPDARMTRFFGSLLPQLVGDARSKFDSVKHLLGPFASREMTYKEFYTELQIELGRWVRSPHHDEDDRFIEDEDG